MYMSYLLDKETGMYSNSIRRQTQNFMQYGEFTSYHHVTGISDPHAQTTSLWNPVYEAPLEQWSLYGHSAGFPGSNPVMEQIRVSSPELTSISPAGPGILPSLDSRTRQYSPDSQRRNSYTGIRRNIHSSSTGGKTRTKDKYRVVYTDQQRLELEKEFQSSRYITIRRKTELSLGLSLSERQVKIWFQNRRAKERKITKKKILLSQQASTTTPTLTPPSLAYPSNGSIATSCSSLLSETISTTIKEEF
ncbi:homeobox protein CDX-1 [Salmo salar]|uniref:Homeobox protein CDX-1 n=1 Tax=Salmo salar TaxID=8030 RepID=A0A1S3SUG0_SALSA|nr:homeobox protein CDX-1-like [Salmo salar]|eukprot:XP_014067978.1 PREDICTED: homeobox protein CDX-1-like [Salmo salar]